MTISTQLVNLRDTGLQRLREWVPEVRGVQRPKNGVLRFLIFIFRLEHTLLTSAHPYNKYKELYSRRPLAINLAIALIFSQCLYFIVTYSFWIYTPTWSSKFASINDLFHILLSYRQFTHENEKLPSFNNYKKHSNCCFKSNESGKCRLVFYPKMLYVLIIFGWWSFCIAANMCYIYIQQSFW